MLEVCFANQMIAVVVVVDVLDVVHENDADDDGAGAGVNWLEIFQCHCMAFIRRGSALIPSFSSLRTLRICLVSLRLK